jgi:hypothetical protein
LTEAKGALEIPEEKFFRTLRAPLSSNAETTEAGN